MSLSLNLWWPVAIRPCVGKNDLKALFGSMPFVHNIDISSIFCGNMQCILCIAIVGIVEGQAVRKSNAGKERHS